jgi:hypothetical protein
MGSKNEELMSPVIGMSGSSSLLSHHCAATTPTPKELA